MKRFTKMFFIVILLCILHLLCACKDDSQENITSMETDIPVQTEVVMLPTEDVRVISINVGYDIQNMAARGRLMLPLLLSYQPESIGTQECGGYTSWVDFFREGLVGYERVGHLSNGALETKEHYSGNYIYYNAEKYECLDWYTFWVTETPSRISAINDAIFRTCTWAVFRNKVTGFRYAHVNTHLEWMDDNENRYQMRIIRDICQQLTSLGFPVFATGDFNTSEGSDSYQIMTSTDYMFDSKFLAEDTMDMGTFHGGNPNPVGKKPIDFCFVSGNMMEVHKYEVINNVIDYDTFMSDHNGLFVRATISTLPDQLQFKPTIPIDGITIISSDVRPYVIDLTFTVPTDDYMADKYRVAAIDKDGNEIAVRMIPSRHFDYNAPSEINCTLPGLTPGEKYTVTIAPMTLVGTYGTPFSAQFVTPEE